MRILFGLLFVFQLQAQTALYVNGNMRIHDEGKLGVHTDWINDSPMDQNLGLAGFYGNRHLQLQGQVMPVVYDLEVMNPAHVSLYNSLGVSNNLNLIEGSIRTDRSDENVSLQFNPEAFHTGSGNDTHINGYASVIGQLNFEFPLGANGTYMPLTAISNTRAMTAQAIYRPENPNSPINGGLSFPTTQRHFTIDNVSEIEFWQLDATTLTAVTLPWLTHSLIDQIVEDLDKLTVVGFSKATGLWVDLGKTNVGGDLRTGTITSDYFIPDEYSAIALGSLGDISRLTKLDDYFMSPNGDGINDALTIPETEDSPNNKLTIYNRYMVKVFEQENYTDEFKGIANNESLLPEKGKLLPSDVYFYLLTLHDVDREYQGYLYLSN
ncbi:gliding motility-associated C-terminal domain-containing protein [Sediminicola luteus]|uniref:Gliding motility-associated C-terminal domain-containing protein n=1 Tax=Sediminicola luteus TaxID=319238 RepID=A0A2A4G6S8_9FLAO|nr:gliding motility-associated C-terminal domain-containing protein [Sediminicola luteus]PCE63442.1 hypothetical protein B7P33_14615 [Sediminicola luteus]